MISVTPSATSPITAQVSSRPWTKRSTMTTSPYFQSDEAITWGGCDWSSLTMTTPKLDPSFTGFTT